MSNSLAVYQNFPHIKELAQTLATSDLIPLHFHKKPANILIALEFAHRNDIAPFAAMQSLFVVKGKVGMSATMAISLARKHGAISAIEYEVLGEGDSLKVIAIGTLPNGNKVKSAVTMEMAKNAGWTSNAIYKSLPEQMLRYRAAVFLIRAHFPEVLFGMQTYEELQDAEASIVYHQTKPIIVDENKNVQEIAQTVQKNEQVEVIEVVNEEKMEEKEDIFAKVEKLEELAKEAFSNKPDLLKKVIEKIAAAKSVNELDKLQQQIITFVANQA